MNSTKIIKVVKPVFHALTMAAAIVAYANDPIIGKFVPEKYAQAIAVGSAAISAGLHLITRFWPDVAAAEGK